MKSAGSMGRTLGTVFTWLNAAAFITLVQKIDAATIQKRPLLNALTRCLYTHNFEINCGTNQVRRLFEVRRLTK